MDRLLKKKEKLFEFIRLTVASGRSNGKSIGSVEMYSSAHCASNATIPRPMTPRASSAHVISQEKTYKRYMGRMGSVTYGDKWGVCVREKKPPEARTAPHRRHSHIRTRLSESRSESLSERQSERDSLLLFGREIGGCPLRFGREMDLLLPFEREMDLLLRFGREMDLLLLFGREMDLLLRFEREIGGTHARRGGWGRRGARAHRRTAVAASHSNLRPLASNPRPLPFQCEPFAPTPRPRHRDGSART